MTRLQKAMHNLDRQRRGLDPIPEISESTLRQVALIVQADAILDAQEYANAEGAA